MNKKATNHFYRHDGYFPIKQADKKVGNCYTQLVYKNGRRMLKIHVMFFKQYEMAPCTIYHPLDLANTMLIKAKNIGEIRYQKKWNVKGKVFK